MEATTPNRTATRTRPVQFVTRMAAAVAVCLLAGAVMAIPPPGAVGGLYLQATGRYLCTATVVSGLELDLDHELVVLTAAHCVAGALEPTPDGSSWSSRLGFLLSLDNDTFYEIVPYRVGYPLMGYDLAIMTFRETAPVVAPLHMGSWEAIDFGTEVRNFANPLGMGLQYFSGMVTMLRLEPSAQVRESQTQWRHNAVASLQVGPGSSGSLILNESFEYIGVLSSVIDPSFGSPFTVFVPQWKFAEFLTDDRAGRDVQDTLAWPGSVAVLAQGLTPEARQVLAE